MPEASTVRRATDRPSRLIEAPSPAIPRLKSGGMQIVTMSIRMIGPTADFTRGPFKDLPFGRRLYTRLNRQDIVDDAWRHGAFPEHDVVPRLWPITDNPRNTITTRKRRAPCLRKPVALAVPSDIRHLHSALARCSLCR